MLDGKHVHNIRSSAALKPVPGLVSRTGAQQFDVFGAGWQGLRQTLYDSLSYVAAGQNSLSFFSTAIGAGAAILGGGTKSISDTNLTLQGQLPAGQEFLIESIELEFWPTTPTVAADMPSTTGAAATQNIINDVYIFRRAGSLTFTVASRDYLQEAPLGKFPAKQHFDVSGALAASAGVMTIAYADMLGRPYHLAPYAVLLVASQNFNVTLEWQEGLQAITNPAAVRCVMDGILFRRNQ